MEEKKDAALVAATLAGRQEAFVALVQRHQNYAYGTAVGLLSDFDLAQDVVQEAFLTAYQDLGKLQDPARFGLWLRGIVRNTAHAARRELQRVQALAVELQRDEPALYAAPDRALEEGEDRRIFYRALARLNETSREVLSLHYLNGLPCRDIADFLGIAEGAVKGRLQYARAKMKKEFAMVEKRFKEEGLARDFSAQIEKLLAEANAQASERLVELGAPAVDPLCQALSDEREQARYVAARALCQIGDPRAVQPLLRLLYAHVPWMKWRSDVLQLEQVLAVPGMREALMDTVRRDREGEGMAIRVLSYARDDDEVLALMQSIFRDKSAPPGRRTSAFHTLCQVKPEAALEAVEMGMEDENLLLCSRAAGEAYRRDLKPPLDTCVRAFEKGVCRRTSICAAAAQLILRQGREGEEALQRVMDEGSSATRLEAAMALAREGRAAGIEVIAGELLGMPSGAAVGREDLKHLTNLVWQLAREHPERGGPLVEALLEAVSPSMAAAAVRILARQRGMDFLPLLRCFLKRRKAPKAKVGKEVFRQMLKLGAVAAPVVEAMCGSDSWWERKTAVRLLKRWDRLAPEQQRRAEVDPHIAVRHAARETIAHYRSSDN